MKPKILLVDDEKLNLLTFEAFLAEDGYELHMAENGKAALEIARAIQPDLVLLDIMMPEMDGFTVCREIRADPVIGRVPVIVVTALHDSGSRLEGLRAGADDFVTKPCSREEMRARVRTTVSLNRFRVIAEERGRFERLFAASPTGIVLTDQNGVALSANPKAEGLLGVRPERSLVGEPIAHRFPAEQATVLQQVIADALGSAPVAVQELRRTIAGEQRVLRVRATSATEAGERHAMLIFTDATDEVRAREDLERMNRALDALVHARTRELQDANQLLLSYASFVSHDLRSPLAVMKGYLSLIHEGAVPVAESGEIISRAYEATLMMEELVKNILQLAHDEHEGGKTTVGQCKNTGALVERVWSHVCTLFPHKGRKFKHSALPDIEANPLLVERVFYNLLTNAAKYSAGREQPVIEVGTLENSEGTAFFVRDNGVGFDTRDADKLFHEFSRLAEAPVGGGFGLGLSLVARLVRAHGGRMWADGRAGEGATFFVQFSGAHDAGPPALA